MTDLPNVIRRVQNGSTISYQGTLTCEMAVFNPQTPIRIRDIRIDGIAWEIEYVLIGNIILAEFATRKVIAFPAVNVRIHLKRAPLAAKECGIRIDVDEFCPYEHDHSLFKCMAPPKPEK